MDAKRELSSQSKHGSVWGQELPAANPMRNVLWGKDLDQKGEKNITSPRMQYGWEIKPWNNFTCRQSDQYFDS